MDDDFDLAPEVEAALAELFPSDDPLDRADFDPVEYVNVMFPNEQSLGVLEPFMSKLRVKLDQLDQEMALHVRQQTHSSHHGRQALLDAQAGMAELFARMKDIRAKAELSERMVTEITVDIKTLDQAKKNLAQGITTLNHLHMLINGVDSLAGLAERRQYSEAAHLLAAVFEVQAHFARFNGVDRVVALNTRIDSLKDLFGRQVYRDFGEAFRPSPMGPPQPDDEVHPAALLIGGCEVLDVLNNNVKQELLSWLLTSQLADYRSSFAIDREDSWIDRIERRFAWLERYYKNYGDAVAAVFPPSWSILETISFEYCKITRRDLKTLMDARLENIDVTLLLEAMGKTLRVEKYLAGRFPSKEEDPNPPTEAEAAEEEAEAEAPHRDESNLSDADRIRLRYKREKEAKEKASRPKEKRMKPSRFMGAISAVFSSYMHVYIKAQDKGLEAMLTVYKDVTRASFGGDGLDEKILASAPDLFVFFRKCVNDVVQLNARSAVAELHPVFRRYLRRYAQMVLVANTPKLPLLKKQEQELRLTLDEVFFVCGVLNTAEYCNETTKQLETMLKQKAEPAAAEKLKLEEEADVFADVVSNATQLLVRALETECAAAFAALGKMRWDTVEEVGDASSYVAMIAKAIGGFVPTVRECLASSQKYFINFCLKFANALIPRLVGALYKCKSVSHVGAEQLLLDLQSLKQVLLDLPGAGAASKKQPPANYARFVTKGMAKAEMLIKALMTPHDQAEAFVGDFMRIMGSDEPLATLVRVLEMKGLKKQDMQPLIERFKKVNPAAAVGDATTTTAPATAATAATSASSSAAAATSTAAAGAPGTGPAVAAPAAASADPAAAAAAAAAPAAAPAKPSFKSRFSLPTKPTKKLEQLLKRFQ